MDEGVLSPSRMSTARSTHAQQESGRMQKAPTVLEKERSRTSIGGSAMGTKKASLYLSRTKSTIKSGNSEQKDGDWKREGSVSVVSQNGTRKGSKGSTADVETESLRSTGSMPPLKKEFTFTGYDIMADVDPDTTKGDNLTDREKEKHNNVQVYIAACRRSGLSPVHYLVRHINDKELKMKSHPLGPEGTRAACIALVNNQFVRSLDLEDNDVGADGAECITEMLKQNDKITELNLAENLIGTRGVFSFLELLKDGKQLHTLDISGSNLEDSDGKYVAEIIEFSKHLKVFKVSHNQLAEDAGFEIGRAIAINDKLQTLDLSWNHFRGNGALAIAMGVQKNIGLKVLNLAWNGFALEGCKGMSEALIHNGSLVELDLTNNRIGVQAVAKLLNGLKENECLKCLKLAQNPFSPEVALTILTAVDQSEKCVLTTLDLSDIVVREDFIKLWQDIRKRRALPLRVLFGATVKSLEVKSGEDYGIDWRDPVMRLYKYMHDNGYRVIDLLKRLDKDRNFQVDRDEFKQGMLSEGIPMTEAQLDQIVDGLDTDGDGEVDFGELIQGEKEFKRKLRMRMKKFMKDVQTLDSTTRKLRRIQEL